MKIIIAENYEQMSKISADIIKETVQKNPTAVLGLATGSTPIGMYKELIKMNQNNEIDFSRISTVNLDEYVGLIGEDYQSYRYFMDNNLFNHINIDKRNTFIPSGVEDNYEQECKNYDVKIEELGGIDLQVLGIGANGHIGFNEPADILTYGTHKTSLAESTISSNSRFFKSIEEVPRYAITMGVGMIMHSKKIILMVKGNDKAKAVKQIIDGEITTKNPATMLQLHRDVNVIIEKQVYDSICKL